MTKMYKQISLIPQTKIVVYLSDDVCLYSHVGDLGNVEVTDGSVQTTITDHLVTLYGPLRVIGRAFVVSIISTACINLSRLNLLSTPLIYLPRIAHVYKFPDISY